MFQSVLKRFVAISNLRFNGFEIYNARVDETLLERCLDCFQCFLSGQIGKFTNDWRDQLVIFLGHTLHEMLV